jgi:hypothetical protein
MISFEEKKAIVLDRYQKAYKIKIDPKLPEDKVLELYENLIKLQRSQRAHVENENNPFFLKLIK